MCMIKFNDSYTKIVELVRYPIFFTLHCPLCCASIPNFRIIGVGKEGGGQGGGGNHIFESPSPPNFGKSIASYT